MTHDCTRDFCGVLAMHELNGYLIFLGLAQTNHVFYSGNPRVGTMLELTRLVDHIDANMYRFDAPFLALHGTSDTITSPEGSKDLYERAAAKDRTLKLYEGACHSLIQGEQDDIKEAVLQDMKTWLDERVERKQ